MNNLKVIGVVAGVAVVLFLIGWYEVSLWRECRLHDHSWWYCMRILSR